jgi:putative glutamine amidotransferase
MTRPLIGISGRRWPAKFLAGHLPFAMHDLFFDLHFCDYPKSVALAGGLPIELCRDADVEDIVSRLDGLVLSGGADVDPELYGEAPDANLGRLEPERDEWESALYKAAQRKGIPVLAICRGFQLVNVLHGGTLHQHVELDEGAGHPQWDVEASTATHQVKVVAGTTMAQLHDRATPVNSLHHQTLNVVGEGLVVNARADDGVVEGYESTDGRLLGVQWHPEMMVQPDPVFHWLVRQAIAMLD